MLSEFLSLSGFLLLAWFIYEPLYRLKWRDRTAMRLTGWLLRPWTVWAIVNLIYRMNPKGSFEHIKTAPNFFKELYPLFASLWEPDERFSESLIRLLGTPTVYIWGAVVLVLSGLIVWLALVILKAPSFSRGRRTGLLAGLFVLCFSLHVSIACLPNGAVTNEEREGSLLSCWQAHTTMLYTVQYVKSKSIFLRHFHEQHPKLRPTIHGISHPPGATLSMYWLGNMAGAKGMSVRLPNTRIRYAVALTLAACLNVFVVYLLGWSFTGDERTGLVVSLLWLTAPAMMIYSGWAQDVLYAVFFNLALLGTWKVCTAPKTPWLWMVLLGLVFFALNWLTYAWCVATLLFALYALYSWRANRWSFKEAALRGVIPLGLMTVLSAAVLIHYGLNYLTMYKVSSEYVKEWYHFRTLYHHTIAYVGGQVELWVLMGAVTLSAFLTAVCTKSLKRSSQAQWVLLAMVLTVHFIPILFGPNPLRMETARCWGWILTLPLCFAAREMLARKNPRAYVLTAMLSSILIYSGMRLFINFAG